MSLYAARMLGSSVVGIIAVFAWIERSSFSVDHPLLLAAMAVCCLPIYGLWAWALFGSTANALRAVRWVFVRDHKSLFRGDYTEDKFAEVRLGVLAALCVVTVAASYTAVLSLYRLLS